MIHRLVLDAVNWHFVESTKAFALALSCISTPSRCLFPSKRKLSVTVTVIYLSCHCYQDHFVYSPNIFLFSQKCFSLENHLLINVGKAKTGKNRQKLQALVG